ncbi:hypothetical protein ABE288_06340 [Bacillus salipaludis]|uniref:Uncharacterized protein n=1 Tax=Bacillus salipaludis TaxID=2547811 RepID=A0AA90QWQ0_9BACI|nr:hypothetical protein [Bacillus salipaludis]MDQ6594860.1 hypothetical protein [Bacillus salipaludis]MED1472116.1 hypothetical protein [Bacillus salipaludis]
MQLNYENARHLEGELVRFKKENGEWAVGRVVEVRQDGLEIVEFNPSYKNEGYGYGFWGACFIPFCWPIFPFCWF